MTTLEAPTTHLNLVGHTYGTLLVLTYSHTHRYTSGGSATFWTVQCSCGTTKIVKGNHLRTGQTTTCGDQTKHPRAGWRTSGHYNAVHDRTRRSRGTPDERLCAHQCGDPATDWAHIHGTDPADSMNYMPLCRPCHRTYDLKD